MGCHFLLHGIFPTQGWNWSLLHCRWILYHWATWEAQLLKLALFNTSLFPIKASLLLSYWSQEWWNSDMCLRDGLGIYIFSVTLLNFKRSPCYGFMFLTFKKWFLEWKYFPNKFKCLWRKCMLFNLELKIFSILQGEHFRSGIFVHLHNLHKAGPRPSLITSFKVYTLHLYSLLSTADVILINNLIFSSVSYYTYMLCKGNSKKAGKNEELHVYLVLWNR